MARLAELGVVVVAERVPGLGEDGVGELVAARSALRHELR